MADQYHELDGDVRGNYFKNVVRKIRGVLVSTTTPTTNQVLTYDGTQWAPATPATPTAFTDWTSFTPVLEAGTTDPTLGTASSATGSYMRIGNMLFVKERFLFGSSGVNQGSGEYFVLVPGSFTIDTSDVAKPLLGQGTIYDSGVNQRWNVAAVWDSGNSRIRFYLDSAGTTVYDNNPFTWAANDEFLLDLAIPIT